MRCFIHRADKDYLSARLNYKHNSTENFLWSSQQCLEKYIKAILLCNGDNADTGHNLSKAYSKLFNKNRCFYFERFPRSCYSNGAGVENLEYFVKRIGDIGNNRYGTNSYSTRGDELLKLDGAVYELRRYCVFPESIIDVNGKIDSNELLEKYINSVHQYKRIRIVGGYLESLVSGKDKCAQLEILKWKNQYFGDESCESSIHDQYPWRVEGNNAVLSNSYHQASDANTKESKKYFTEAAEYLLEKVHFTKKEKKELQNIMLEFSDDDISLDTMR